MRYGRIVAAAICAAVICTGVAIAFVQSRVEASYPSGYQAVVRVQANINAIRVELGAVTAEELRGSPKEVSRYLNKELPANVKLVKSSLVGELTKETLPVDKLDRNQLTELLSLLVIYGVIKEENNSLPVTSYAEGKLQLSDAELYEAILRCSNAIVSGGGDFVKTVSSFKDLGTIQEHRALFLLEMARFDQLIAYFIILTERTA